MKKLRSTCSDCVQSYFDQLREDCGDDRANDENDTNSAAWAGVVLASILMIGPLIQVFYG